MEKNDIQIKLQRWLSRKTPMSANRQVIDLPVSLASDVGSVRVENQDRLVLMRAQVTSRKSFVVGVLCDGMGGMKDGRKCAELSVSTFISSCILHRKLDMKERLLKAVHSANDAVYNEYQGDGGATLSAFILDSDMQLEAVNVGDSRIYVTANNKFEQVTKDDTIAGQLEEKKMQSSELSNQLLQHIGIGSSIEPHFIDFPDIKNISKILITSDGAHYLAHETLKGILSPSLHAAELSKRLIHVAKWCGGHDNASALVLTDLPSLFNIDEKSHTGTIDVWDPYGDVQLIGIEKHYLIDGSIFQSELENNIKSKGDIPINTLDGSDKSDNYQKAKRAVKNDVEEGDENSQDLDKRKKFKKTRQVKKGDLNKVKNVSSNLDDFKKTEKEIVKEGIEKPQLRIDFNE